MAETQVTVPKRNLPTKLSTISDLKGLLDEYKAQIQMVLPKVLTVDRLFKMATYAATVNPGLLVCNPASILRAIMLAGSFGLEAGGPKAHLVPFRNTRMNRTDCQLIIDYKGLVDLARRSGQVSNIISRIVWDKEPFEIDESREYPYIHKQLPPSERGKKKIGVYAVAKEMDGRVIANDFMWAEEIEVIKERSLRQKKNKSENPWEKFEEEMWKKSPIRRMAKMMPQSPELQQAAIIEEAREAGIPMATPVELDLGLAEEEVTGSGIGDVQQKTEEKANALTEKLKAEREKTSGTEQATGSTTGTTPPPAGETAGPAASHETSGEQPTKTPAENTQDPGAPGPGVGKTPEGGAQGELPGTKETKKKRGAVAKPPEDTGDIPVPEKEEGKELKDYWRDEKTVKCPPKGDKTPYLVDISYCNKLCPQKKVCFVFQD
jgi:recombination protein RecT